MTKHTAARYPSIFTMININNCVCKNWTKGTIECIHACSPITRQLCHPNSFSALYTLLMTNTNYNWRPLLWPYLSFLYRASHYRAVLLYTHSIVRRWIIYFIFVFFFYLFFFFVLFSFRDESSYKQRENDGRGGRETGGWKHGVYTWRVEGRDKFDVPRRSWWVWRVIADGWLPSWFTFFFFTFLSCTWHIHSGAIVAPVMCRHRFSHGK